MPRSGSLKTFEHYLQALTQHAKEVQSIRRVILDCGLAESIKWGAPVYTLGGKNVVGIGVFKSYFGVWFFQGALLSDPQRKLINAQVGRTKALRQLRYHSAEDIDLKVLRRFVLQAKELAERGVEIKPERNRPLNLPWLLESELKRNKTLKARFQALRLSQRREFAEHIESAKRLETRQRRMAAIIPLILEGRGLHDRPRTRSFKRN